MGNKFGKKSRIKVSQNQPPVQPTKTAITNSTNSNTNVTNVEKNVPAESTDIQCEWLFHGIDGRYNAEILKKIIPLEIDYYAHVVSLFYKELFTGFEFKVHAYNHGSGTDHKMHPIKKTKFIDTTLAKMIKEYEFFMFSLSNKFKNTSNMNDIKTFLKNCIIPISVQLLWRCHLLHPIMYYKDCMKHFGFLLLPTNNILCRTTKTYTKEIFSNVINGENNDKFTELEWKTTVIKQIDFMAKTTQCLVWRTDFIGHLDCYISRYIKFLKTASKLLENRSDIKKDIKSLSPTFNIDLLWHTHMLYPKIYQTECPKITNGIIVDHDDISINDNDTENYWKYGKPGQFNQKYYVNVILKEKMYSFAMGYVRENYSKELIPKDVFDTVFTYYFDEDHEKKQLTPTPPPLSRQLAPCKMDPASVCCVGEHMRFRKSSYSYDTTDSEEMY
eukprot:402072_1